MPVRFVTLVAGGRPGMMLLIIVLAEREKFMKTIGFIAACITGIILITASALIAQENEPLLVFIEKDPWLMVIGSDSPSFALYESGEVIFLKQVNNQSLKYYSVILSSKEQAFHLKSLLPPESFFNLKDEYVLSDWTDQPTNYFLVNQSGQKKVIEVYGDLRRDEEVRKNAPQEIVNLFEQLSSFDHPKTKRWLPEKIEVMFWPYEYAPDASIIWPKEWPDLESTDTKKRNEVYSVYVPSDKYQELLDFLKTRKERGAIEINGKKMAISLRFPFPNEEMWMK